MMVLGFLPAVAVVTINIAKIFTGLASGLFHWRLGNVRRDWFIPLLIGGLIGGLIHYTCSCFKADYVNISLKFTMLS